MPPTSPAAARKQIESGRVDPVYLILGDDQTGKMALAGDFLELVEVGLRAFNVDRMYGGETTARAVVDAARTLPMMVARRVVLLLHAERLLVPKKDTDATSRDLEALDAYIKAPVDTSCLVMVADGLDKRRSFTKLLMAKTSVVECTGPRDAMEAAMWVRESVAREGKTIDARASRLVADRTGPDIGRLRADVERLVLYAGDATAIAEADVREVVGAATSQDDWGVTRALERGSAADALRELSLALQGGAVPYMVLGQLAWFARAKMPAPQMKAAIEAVFRTDLAIKTSAGDPRVLLERLVVELCGNRR